MRRVVVGTILAVMLAAPSARAQGAARAEALFEEAKALMSKGDYTKACPKFAASQKLDPGVGTLLNLGTCYERQGRAASAWATFQEAALAARRANQEERARFAEKRAAELAQKLAHVVIRVGDQKATLEVKLDGTVVDSSEWGSSLPLDPGQHTIEVSAPGKRSWTTTIEVAAGTSAESDVAVPVLSDETPTHVDQQKPLVAEIEPPPAPTASSPLRPIGIVVGALGIVGVGVGLGFGINAMSKNNEALTHCPMSPQCNDQLGVDLTHDAQGSATASTIAFIVGGVMLAAGVTLFLVAPRTKHSVTATFGPFGGALGGTF